MACGEPGVREYSRRYIVVYNGEKYKVLDTEFLFLFRKSIPNSFYYDKEKAMEHADILEKRDKIPKWSVITEHKR